MPKCELCKNFKNSTITSNCEHSICSECIYKQVLFKLDEFIISENIDENINYKCVICEEGEFTISNRQLAQFMENIDFSTVEEIEFNCLKHNKKFKFFCKICDIRLCLICMEDHPENHDFRNLLCMNVINNELNCKNHSEKIIKFHCSKCNKFLCSVCKEISHVNHNMLEIAEYSSKLKLILGDVKMPYDSDIKSFNENFDQEFQETLRKVKSSFTRAENEITQLRLQLEEISKLFKKNSTKVEEDFQTIINLFKIIINNYSRDLTNSQSNEFVKLYFLDKLPKSFPILKFNHFFDETFNKTIPDIKDKMTILKSEIQNIKNVNLVNERTLTGHTSYIYSIVQLQNGLIASGSADKSIKLWDPNQHYKCIQTLNGHSDLVWSVTESKNGLICSGSEDTTIKLWDRDSTQNYKCVQTLTGHSAFVRSILHLQNGLIASGSADNTIRLWEWDRDANDKYTYQSIQTLYGHDGWIFSLIQLHNGLIASGSLDSTIKLWDPNQNYKCVKTLHGHTDWVISITQLHNGLIASGSADKSIKLWDPDQEYQCINTRKGHTGNVYCVFQLHNGIIASGSADKSIKLWDPNQQYQCVQTRKGHTDWVQSITQLQNGLGVSGSKDKNIKIWIF